MFDVGHAHGLELAEGDHPCRELVDLDPRAKRPARRLGDGIGVRSGRQGCRNEQLGRSIRARAVKPASNFGTRSPSPRTPSPAAREDRRYLHPPKGSPRSGGCATQRWRQGTTATPDRQRRIRIRETAISHEPMALSTIDHFTVFAFLRSGNAEPMPLSAADPLYRTKEIWRNLKEVCDKCCIPGKATHLPRGLASPRCASMLDTARGED